MMSVCSPACPVCPLFHHSDSPDQKLDKNFIKMRSSEQRDMFTVCHVVCLAGVVEGHTYGSFASARRLNWKVARWQNTRVFLSHYMDLSPGWFLLFPCWVGNYIMTSSSSGPSLIYSLCPQFESVSCACRPDLTLSLPLCFVQCLPPVPC